MGGICGKDCNKTIDKAAEISSGCGVIHVESKATKSTIKKYDISTARISKRKCSQSFG